MENTNSSEQIVKKQTRIQRRVGFYSYPAPLKVLMDVTVIRAVHDKKIGKSLISTYLEHDVQLFVTRCIMAESGLSRIPSKDISLLSCSHGKDEEKTCILDLIGSTNPESYFVATGRGMLLSNLRQIPSVPVIKFHRRLRLKKPLDLQKAKDAGQVKGAPQSKRAASASVEDTLPEVPLKKGTIQAKDAAHVQVKSAPKSKTAASASASVEHTSSEVHLKKRISQAKYAGAVQVKGAPKSKRAPSSSVENTSSEASLRKRTLQAKDAGPVEVKGAPKRKRSASLSVEDTSSQRTVQAKDAGPLSYVLSDELFQKEKIAENKKYHWALNPICHDDSSDDDPTHIPAVRRAYARAAGLSSEIDKDPTNTVVFVVGFTISGNFDVVRDQLREVFRSCGDIKRIYITQDKITGLPKNVAFITFADRRSVFKALRLTGTDVGRTAITVQESGIGGRYHRLAGREFVD